MKAEQLRKSILQLAIQGKLVPQDPADEPASVLLERIRTEKQRLIKEGKIKKDKGDSVIFKGDDNCYYEKTSSEVKNITDEIPFDIPDTWCWVRHNELFEISGGSQPPKAKFKDTPQTGFVRLFQIRDYGKNPQPIYISIDAATKTTKKGDILLARYGASLGKVFWAEDGAYNVAMAKVIPLFDIKTISNEYLFLYYKSSLYQDTIIGHSRSAQAGFNKDDLSKMFFVLPPLSEQIRIVNALKNIEPLIAEYDKLEQQAMKLDGEIYDKLKKSILQYAIQGKLVPQDSNDEPASVLLERIRAEKKAQLGKKYVESYIYKGDDNCYYEKVGSETKNITDEIPFDIPDSWEWARVDTLFQHNTGKALNSANTKGNYREYITTSNLYWNYFKLDSLKKMLFTDEEIDKCSLKKGDLLVCEGGDIGRAAIWNYDIPMCIQNHIHRLRAYSAVETKFYYCVLYLYKQLGIIGGKGIGIQGLSTKALGRIIFPVPPLAEQKRIIEQINVIFSKFKDEI